MTNTNKYAGHTPFPWKANYKPPHPLRECSKDDQFFEPGTWEVNTVRDNPVIDGMTIAIMQCLTPAETKANALLIGDIELILDQRDRLAEALRKAIALLDKAGRTDHELGYWQPGMSWIFPHDKKDAYIVVQEARAAITELETPK